MGGGGWSWMELSGGGCTAYQYPFYINHVSHLNYVKGFQLQHLLPCYYYYTEAATRGVLQKGPIKSFAKIQRKAPAPESFYQKQTLGLVFSYEFCEIFKNTFLQNTFGQLLLTRDLISSLFMCFSCVQVSSLLQFSLIVSYKFCVLPKNTLLDSLMVFS